MGRGKLKSTFKDGDRFRAKPDSSDVMPYRDKEIVVAQALNPSRSMFLMAADGEHFEAHRDWLYSYWEKISSLEPDPSPIKLDKERG